MVPRWLSLALAIALALIVPADSAWASPGQPGSLVTGFGNGGVATANFGGTSEKFNAIAIQPSDGKIVAVGPSGQGSTRHTDFAIARFNTSGALDTTFNPSGAIPGTQLVDFANGTDQATSVAIQNDGGIVIAGITGVGFQSIAVARLTSAGALDTSFNPLGTEPGTEKVAGTGNVNDIVRVAIQPSDQKIVLAGGGPAGTTNGFLVVRLGTDGTPDSGFGPGMNGRVSTQIEGGNNGFAVGAALALDGNEKIVVGGYANASSGAPFDFAVARYTSGGALDTTFNAAGTNPGTQTVDFGGAADRALGLAIQPSDGAIVLAGDSNTNPGHSGCGTSTHWAVARVTSAGAPDMSFNSTGQVTTPFSGATYDCALGVSVNGSGKITAVGKAEISGNDTLAIARYNTDGSLDQSFGDPGTQTYGSGTGAGLAGAGNSVFAAGTNSNGSTAGNPTVDEINNGVGSAPGTPAACITPSPFDFGSVFVGNSSRHVFTVTSCGTANLLVRSVDKGFRTPRSTEYAVEDDACTGGTLAPGTACTFAVRFSPALPTASSKVSVYVFDNATDSPQFSAISGSGVERCPLKTSVPRPCADLELRSIMGIGALTGALAEPDELHFDVAFANNGPDTSIAILNIAVPGALSGFPFEITKGLSRYAQDLACEETSAASFRCRGLLQPGEVRLVDLRVELPTGGVHTITAGVVPGGNSDPLPLNNGPRTLSFEKVDSDIVVVSDSKVAGKAQLVGANKHGRVTAAGFKDRITKVQVAVLRVTPGIKPAKHAKAKPRCMWLRNVRAKFKSVPAQSGKCVPSPVWLRASGTTKWKLTFKKRLPRGRYVVYSRAVELSGVTESAFSARLKNRKAFRVP